MLKPGGVLVMTDSVQLGDRPEHDSAMIKGTFTELNEPHYPSYIQVGGLLSWQPSCNFGASTLLASAHPAACISIINAVHSVHARSVIPKCLIRFSATTATL